MTSHSFLGTHAPGCHAFEMFSKEYRAALAAIKAADVKLETVYSSHLLNALPPALSAFQTSLAITNSSELPSTDRILDLVRNEVLRLLSSLSSTSVALTASSEMPPPSPCPACKGAHWLRDCTSPEGRQVPRATQGAQLQEPSQGQGSTRVSRQGQRATCIPS